MNNRSLASNLKILHSEKRRSNFSPSQEVYMESNSMRLFLGGKRSLEMGGCYLQKARSDITSMWNCDFLVSSKGELWDGM